MANIITYPTVTPASTDLVLGNYINTDGISETKTFTVASIAASGGGGSSVTSLNDLTDCLIDTGSAYIGTVPSGLSGNPQGNTTLGMYTGLDLTTGVRNTLIGIAAGRDITTGSSNIAIGANTLQNGSSTVTQTIAIGTNAGNFSTASGGVYLGGLAGFVNTGQGNVFVGYNAGRSSTSGIGNTDLGNRAGYANTTSSNRVCVGYQAGYYITGADNTFIGFEAGYGGASGVGGVGSQNTIIGKQAGLNLTSGSSNVLIGKDAGSTLTTGSNSIVIGQNAEPSAATTSNEITLGNASITSLRVPGLQSGATDGDVLTFSSSTNNITLKSGSLTKLVTLSAAQIISLNGTSSLELIPAPGAGKIIVVSDILLFLDYGGVAFNITGSGSVRFAYGSSAGLLGTNYVGILNKTADYYIASNQNLEPEVNQALNFKSDSIAVTAGNSLVKFNIVYRILDATTLA